MKIRTEFNIMIDPKGKIPRNIFITDRFSVRDARPPPPPIHFRYETDDRDLICYYTIVEDENDPPPPTSLLRLSEMSSEWLRKAASGNGLRGWEFLGKNELVKFLEAHRYVFSDDFYKHRSLPDQLRTWVGLFAVDNFAEHYAEVMTNSLIGTNYLSEFVGCEREWWWSRLCFAFDYEIELFSFGMRSFDVFYKLLCLKFEMIVYEVEGIFYINGGHESYNVWCRAVDLEWETMRGKLDGKVWCFEDRVSFLSHLRDRLEEKFFSIQNRFIEDLRI